MLLCIPYLASTLPQRGVTCVNHPYNESTALCWCSSMGDGLHAWGLNWTTSCDQLLFSPGQPDPRHCGSDNVTIDGHGNTSLSPSFVSELEILIRDSSFIGLVNCSVIRGNDTRENVGDFTISGTCVHVCYYSVYKLWYNLNYPDPSSTG